ncbi:hypothetical protein DXG01_006593 [Tephrocybe rancida]|nr:hypothetical protein DXG01_006593 [Tephrocybe rancida]
MVSSLLADALADPTAVLNGLNSDDLDAFPAAVTEHFKQIFRTQNAFTEIPPLTVPENHADREIVRFRAMVQDTSASPEMYLARRTGGRWGGWGQADDDNATATIDYADLRECTVLWAVSVPGESAWCASIIDDADTPKSKKTHTPPHPHKFPVPGASHVGVQIKIYTNDRSTEKFKATDLYTFVGIITSEPLHADLELDTPGLVPTLHVLFSQTVPSTIIPRVYPSTSYSKDLRNELIAWIADTALAGDRDAAEWVLLSTISRVQSRTPPILPLSLTLSRFPSPNGACTTPALAHALSQVFALLTNIPLSLETLNNTSCTPESKNEDLYSGWLQLPKGSICLITEGGVTEGKLSDRGIMNLHAVQETMSTQTLEYAFPFSRFAFDTNIAFIVLAEGKKSAFFQTDINIPLQPTTAEFDPYVAPEKIKVPTRDKLEAFRSLVGAAKVGNMSVGEKTAKFIQEDFVKERQAAPSSTDAPSSEDLIQRMMIARSVQKLLDSVVACGAKSECVRLLALSRQELEITVEVWEAAKVLEDGRKARAA